MKYVGKIPDKPRVILDALNNWEDFIVYLDSDVRIKQPIDEIVGDYDVGITTHDVKFHTGEERYLNITGYLNAGVIFLNNTDKAKEFVKRWIEYVRNSKTGSDQEALTNFLRDYVVDWTKENHNILGSRVKFFPSPVYNYTGIRGECENPKLVHYCGTVQDKINNGALK